MFYSEFTTLLMRQVFTFVYGYDYEAVLDGV